MIGPLEDLALFGDGANYRFKGRPFVMVAESPCLDLGDDLADSPADGPEVLEAFLPEEPGPVGSARILLPAGNQGTHR